MCSNRKARGWERRTEALGFKNNLCKGRHNKQDGGKSGTQTDMQTDRWTALLILLGMGLCDVVAAMRLKSGTN